MAEANSSELKLPSYSVRESRRAKNVRIKISFLGEVEVIVPQGFNLQRLPELLQQRQGWITETTQRLAAERQSLVPEPVGALPEQIVLRSLSEAWRVEYFRTVALRIRVTTKPANRLILSGQTDNTDDCRRILRNWLSYKAHIHLEPWLRQTSQEVALPCDKISVRGQKTRWASCSNRKSISLNYKLLFLPTSLVRYVFIHELCHTIQLNHSPRFWALVVEKEPDYERLDAELRKAWHYVPEWVEPSKLK